MSYKSAKEIRQAFLDFFHSKQHQIVPSAPIVVKNDPTLLFTNAGMNQFKDYFLGNRTPDHARIADTQKCLRVSGKHNDLEEVGVDTYHHTMFEMLGNWSFGDYFKEEAIAWSWELLTHTYKLDKDRLYVTVFEGDAKDNLPKDQESYDFWKQHIAEDRILLGNKKDNFWEMGDTGPCGPCTEIHVDCRPDAERKAVDGKALVNNDHPQVIEIWNNVFIQFNRLKDGSLELLPAKHVDTGMGFERLVRVLQGKSSNYDTDVFSGTIAETEKIAGKQYDGSDEKPAIAFRVIADHIRAVSFTIADGQLPSNTGAGYVIRRILRRAVRYYFSYLDRKQPLLHLLVPVLAKQFTDVFPELQKQVDFVSKVVLEEENSFLKTLESGLKRLDHIIGETTGKTIDGKAAFELFDTFGFPIDLTRLIASEQGLNVDEAEFEAELQKQKERSRAATELSMDDWIILKEGDTKFVGYDNLEVPAEVLKYRKVTAKGKEQFQVVLDQTPFYAESGGQVGDTGSLLGKDWSLAVVDTKKENDLVIHFVETLPENLSGPVTAIVDAEKRISTARNHTATHLLHAALRQVLGTHVAQKGSLNNSDYLRFDFSHFAKMTAEELDSVERIVNEKIRQNIPVVIKEMAKDEALKLGAMALFGEKYGDMVRVVVIDPQYSVELCGGTHVGATGELGFFKILSEGAVAAGVRRVEAVSGESALVYLNQKLEQLAAVTAELKNPKDLVKAVQQLQADNASLKKQLERFELEALNTLKDTLKTKITDKAGISVLIENIDNVGADGLKKLAFDLKNEVPNLFLTLTSVKEDKAFIAVLISDNLVKEKNWHAGNLVKEWAKQINGGGGGQPFFASASGTDAGGLDSVRQAALSLFF